VILSKTGLGGFIPITENDGIRLRWISKSIFVACKPFNKK